MLLLQVGNWSLESQYWGVYEGLTEATMPRPGYNVTTAAGASDLAGSMAAAFAASALVFKESDPTFAAELTTAATEMYTQVSMQDLSVMVMAVVVLVTFPWSFQVCAVQALSLQTSLFQILMIIKFSMLPSS